VARQASACGCRAASSRRRAARCQARKRKTPARSGQSAGGASGPVRSATASSRAGSGRDRGASPRSASGPEVPPGWTVVSEIRASVIRGPSSFSPEFRAAARRARARPAAFPGRARWRAGSLPSGCRSLIGSRLRVRAHAAKQPVEILLILAAQRAAELRPPRHRVVNQLPECGYRAPHERFSPGNTKTVVARLFRGGEFGGPY